MKLTKLIELNRAEWTPFEISITHQGKVVQEFRVSILTRLNFDQTLNLRNEIFDISLMFYLTGKIGFENEMTNFDNLLDDKVQAAFPHKKGFFLKSSRTLEM